MKKIILAVFGVVLLSAIAILFFASRNAGDPDFLARLDAPGSLAERLGRPVKWLHIDFEEDFFDNFEQFNASGELEPPWQTNVLADNDTIAVSLPNWAAIDDLDGADHLPIPRDEIRELSDFEFVFLKRFRHDTPEGSFYRYYNMLFFNRAMVDRFKETCRPLVVYEAIRLMGLPKDKEKLYGSANIEDCTTE